MSKSGSLVVLNDLKKEREEIEKKYNEQKNKKFTDKQTLLYCFGFSLIFGFACVVCPDNMMACASMFVGYGLGVPFTYAYFLFSKEDKLRKKLLQIDKNIENLELDIVSLCSSHHFDEKDKSFVYEGNVFLDNNLNLNTSLYNEEYVQEEKGPSLRLRK